jgi:excisionase family DNA binding protein
MTKKTKHINIKPTLTIGKDIELYDLDAVAEALLCSRGTVARYVRLGKLKARKVGKRYLVSKENLQVFTGSILPNSSQ